MSMADVTRAHATMIPVVPNEKELKARYKSALAKMQSGAQEPVLICEEIDSTTAQAFADKKERRGLFFVPKSQASPRGVGSLYLFVDPTGLHDAVAPDIVGQLGLLLAPWTFRVIPGVRLLVPRGQARRTIGGGFREPDESLYVVRSKKLTLTTVIEVAFSQPYSKLLERMTQWVGPGGPARVAIGVKIEYGTPPGQMPRVEVMLQLSGQSAPSAKVECGAASGCFSPGMYDHTLFIPVKELLYDSPWLLRQVISMQLAVVTPLISIVLGGPFALWDMLCGRREVTEVGKACLRSLRGPWWGVVPLDTYWISEQVELSVNEQC